MKTRAAIIGPGNIGTDLLLKALRSDIIEPVWIGGRGGRVRGAGDRAEARA
jgi:acetaldehyde dehydrogenase (acetylating)